MYISNNPSLAICVQILPEDCQNFGLSLNSKEKCEGLLKLNECSNALKTMQINKTPGTDGFPCECYYKIKKKIWASYYYKRLSIHFPTYFSFISISETP